MRNTRTLAALTAALLAGCAGQAAPPNVSGQDAGTPSDSGTPEAQDAAEPADAGLPDAIPGGEDAMSCGTVVTGTVRDFHAFAPNADFQCASSGPDGSVDPGQKTCGVWDPAYAGPLGTHLGPEKKPIYAALGRTPTTTGEAAFRQWYTDVPGVNLSQAYELELAPGADGTYVFDTDRFFPIDGQLFAAEANDPDHDGYHDTGGAVRNFHFTYELHTRFRYDVGNVFKFRGDDDVLVFVDGKLAINLGGIHVPLEGQLDLDTGRVEITLPVEFRPRVPAPTATPELGLPDTIEGGVAGTVDLGLMPGQEYDMDFFFAERNCCASNFRLETNLVFVRCGDRPF